MLAIKLDNVIIDGVKIHENPPRFVRKYGGGLDAGGESLKGKFNLSLNRPWKTKRSFRVESKVGNKFFVEVLSNKGKGISESSTNFFVCYDTKAEDLFRFFKVFVDRVTNPWMSYNIQTCFETEGYFSIKVTHLGANLCLLEGLIDGEILDFIREGESWWKH